MYKNLDCCQLLPLLGKIYFLIWKLSYNPFFCSLAKTSSHPLSQDSATHSPNPHQFKIAFSLQSSRVSHVFLLASFPSFFLSFSLSFSLLLSFCFCSWCIFPPVSVVSPGLFLGKTQGPETCRTHSSWAQER